MLQFKGQEDGSGGTKAGGVLPPPSCAGLAALLVAVSPPPPQAETASMWAPARTSPNSWMTGTALQSCSSATEYAHRT